MEVICVCGIIACVVRQRPERAARRLFDIYRNQQERGRSGFGYAMSRNGSMSRKRVQKQGDIFGAGRLLADLRPGDCVLGLVRKGEDVLALREWSLNRLGVDIGDQILPIYRSMF